MSLMSLSIPPGVYRNGTELQSAGRYYDANLVRFANGTLRPIGGWRLRSSTAAAISGPARAVLAWRDNDGGRWVAAGAVANLYVQDNSGVVHDITPTGLTAGLADAAVSTGYGGGDYGSSLYGVARPDTGQATPAAMWSLDSWGEDLVGCSSADGKLYQWSLDISAPAAAIANAPTGCVGLVVTAEGFLFALGAGGDPRKIAWCDQQNDTLWTPDATNQAGDYDLQTLGLLMCGRTMKGVVFILTSVDAWTASYIGFPLVYGFQQAGKGCGAISQQALATMDTQAAWMGQDGFWLYNGYVQPLPCQVSDLVFGDINRTQQSKVSAVHLSAFGEVWWFYPSAASTECDRYVAWDYRQDQWLIGQIDRLCGADKGVFANPLMIDSSGLIYEHEVGFDYGGDTPYAETGPIKLGEGDRMLQVQRIVPDETTAGDVTVTFTAKTFPEDAGTTYGPYVLSSPTDVLFMAGQVKCRFTGAAADDWRVGDFRLDVVPADPLI
jgi:hypothetical protein